MPSLKNWFYPATTLYLILVLVVILGVKQRASLPVNQASVTALNRATALLQEQGYKLLPTTERFAVFWMRDARHFVMPDCPGETWLFAADASVNLPQYVRAAMGQNLQLTYVFHQVQGDTPLSLIRLLHRYALQVAARLGLRAPPLSSFLMVARPAGCPAPPDLRAVYRVGEA